MQNIERGDEDKQSFLITPEEAPSLKWNCTLHNDQKVSTKLK